MFTRGGPRGARGAVGLARRGSPARRSRDGIGGMVDDDLAYVAPWGFDPADITVPVLVLHGAGRPRGARPRTGAWLAVADPVGRAVAAARRRARVGAGRRARTPSTGCWPAAKRFGTWSGAQSVVRVDGRTGASSATRSPGVRPGGQRRRLREGDPPMSVRERPRTLAAALLAVALMLVAAVVTSSPASAHGSVTDPPTRNYGCWERWGANHLDPAMAQMDPMCWQAWQADPNAMWNWNGLYRESVGGNHQAVIPDGQLCSGGRTQTPRYDAARHPRRLEGEGRPDVVHADADRQRQARRRLPADLRLEAGLRPDHGGARLERPRPGQGDRPLRHDRACTRPT